jgi:predicted N-acetyltransferase YhbS
MTEYALRPETPEDAPFVDALIQRAFGPGRLVKVSERVRERARFRPDLSMCALEEDVLIGCARMWEVRIGKTPIGFLGPLAVEAKARRTGTGAALVAAASDAARSSGLSAVVLVGDEAFFERVGFSAAPAANIVLPGPVDPRRVLIRWVADSAPQTLAGPIE